MSISGKYLSCMIENQIIAGVQGWTVTESVDQLDGTTGQDEGYENDDTGVKRAEIELELVQDVLNGVYLVLSAGSAISNLKVYREQTDPNPAFTFPLAKVYRSPNAGRVKDRFTVNVTARSNGPYIVHDPGA